VDDPGGRVTRLAFHSPYPNPGASHLMRFELPRPGAARLTMFDAAGRVVRRLVKSELPAGLHEARWDGRGDNGSVAKPGVYFGKLEVLDASGRHTMVRRVVRIQ
jgi:hypothetical protein